MTGTTSPKTVAIVSYITFIGWLISYLFLYPKQKDALGAFHLRQTLGLYLSGLVLSIVNRAFGPGLVWGVGSIVGVILFVFWLIGLVNAINGQLKPLPLVGEYFQRWFRNL
ncbi:MAG: hypothetical protein K8F30_14255 [Taibaiella sp.]|nr:hypothetical protein [Taibaiella sp.]